MNFNLTGKNSVSYIWFKETPQNWIIKRLKNHLDRNDGGVWGNEFDEVNGKIVLRSTEQNVDGSWNIQSPAMRDISEKEFESTKLESGDLLITKSSGSSLHIGKTSITDDYVASLNCCFSNFMQRLRVKKDCYPKFFFYFLNSFIGRQQFDYFSNTTTGLANLSAEIIKNLFFAYPPLSVQQSITNFLDYKTSQIDTLIEKKENLLNLLEEKRIALITNAVTGKLYNSSLGRGLRGGLHLDKDGKVKMKPSGIDWLGEIPEHWKIKRLKFLSKIQFSGVDKKTNEDEIEIFLCNYVDVFKNDYIDKSIEFMQATASDHEIKKFLIREGDVLATKDSETPYEIAIPAYVKENFNNVLCGYHLAQIRADNNQLIGSFLFRLFQAINFNSQFVVQANGITRFGLSTDSFGSAIVPYPPTIVEQEKIVGYIDIELKKINSLSKKIEKNIGYLKEYRTSLITSAVTGKIDVRNWHPSTSLSFIRARPELDSGRGTEGEV